MLVPVKKKPGIFRQKGDQMSGPSIWYCFMQIEEFFFLNLEHNTEQTTVRPEHPQYA